MIVLDTHAWVWWVAEPARLSRRAMRAIEGADRIGVPAICCLEVAAAVARGRISIDRDVLDWIEQALAQPKVEFLPLTPRVSVKSTQLGPTFHGDPADRVIVATALMESATLITKDAAIRKSKAVPTIW